MGLHFLCLQEIDSSSRISLFFLHSYTLKKGIPRFAFKCAKCNCLQLSIFLPRLVCNWDIYFGHLSSGLCNRVACMHKRGCAPKHNLCCAQRCVYRAYANCELLKSILKWRDKKAMSAIAVCFTADSSILWASAYEIWTLMNLSVTYWQHRNKNCSVSVFFPDFF